MTKTSREETITFVLVLGQMAWITHVCKKARIWNGLYQVTA